VNRITNEGKQTFHHSFSITYVRRQYINKKVGLLIVIGSGSVVTRDIPDNVIAVGNPCRVIQEITEEDRKYYYKNYEFDVDDYKG